MSSSKICVLKHEPALSKPFVEVDEDEIFTSPKICYLSTRSFPTRCKLTNREGEKNSQLFRRLQVGWNNKWADGGLVKTSESQVTIKHVLRCENAVGEVSQLSGKETSIARHAATFPLNNNFSYFSFSWSDNNSFQPCGNCIQRHRINFLTSTSLAACHSIYDILCIVNPREWKPMMTMTTTARSIETKCAAHRTIIDHDKCSSSDGNNETFVFCNLSYRKNLPLTLNDLITRVDRLWSDENYSFTVKRTRRFDPYTKWEFECDKHTLTIRFRVALFFIGKNKRWHGSQTTLTRRKYNQLPRPSRHCFAALTKAFMSQIIFKRYSPTQSFISTPRKASATYLTFSLDFHSPPTDFIPRSSLSKAVKASRAIVTGNLSSPLFDKTTSTMAKTFLLSFN